MRRAPVRWVAKDFDYETDKRYGPIMPLNDSFELIFKNLKLWRGLPKYALERRIDILLTPFFEPLISARFKGKATLVLAELPLLAGLCELGPEDEVPGDFSALTVNLDYLLHVEREQPCWVFLELKTDPGSNRKPQSDTYRRAQKREMWRLEKDIRFVHRETKSKNKPKYLEVIGALGRHGKLTDPIQLAYLSPTPPEKPLARPGEDGALGEIVHIPLDDFTAGLGWVPPLNHMELWAKVSGLFKKP